MNQKSLVLVKPDGVRKHLIGEIISRFERRGLKICALKMLVIPLLALGVLTLTHLYDLVENGRTVLYICYLAVMTPTASTVAQLAQLYDREPEYAGEINVLTTLLCIVTMPLMTWLYNILI